MKFFLTVYLIVVTSKRLCSILTESLLLQNPVNMFEHMYIAEYIYEVLVEPSYKQSTRKYATHDYHIRKKRGEDASSHNLSTMSEISDKHRKRYVEYTMGKSKTCLIHGPGHSSDKCKVLWDFGSNYAKKIPTKDRGHNTLPRNKFNRQKENNAIVNSAVDEILLHENEKVSAMKE